jgi:hypothetical protein
MVRVHISSLVTYFLDHEVIANIAKLKPSRNLTISLVAISPNLILQGVAYAIVLNLDITISPSLTMSYHNRIYILFLAPQRSLVTGPGTLTSDEHRAPVPGTGDQ